jgi:multiple sugar transport system ATP-binding protein
VILGIRPEGFEDPAFARGLPTIEVVVEVVEDLGSDAHVFFTVDARSITAEVLEAGGEEGLITDGGAMFTARVDPRTTARVGRRLELAIDPARFHFFDPETGTRLQPVGRPGSAPAELAATL